MSNYPFLFPGPDITLTTGTGSPSNSLAISTPAIVRLATTTAVYFIISDGVNVVSNTTGALLPDNSTVLLSLSAGQRVSVLAVTAAGKSTVNTVKATSF